MNLQEFISKAWDKLTGVDAKLEAMAASAQPLATVNKELKDKLASLEAEYADYKAKAAAVADEYKASVESLTVQLDEFKAEAAEALKAKESEIEIRVGKRVSNVLAQQGVDLENAQKAPTAGSNAGSYLDRYAAITDGTEKVRFWHDNKTAIFNEIRAAKAAKK